MESERTLLFRVMAIALAMGCLAFLIFDVVFGIWIFALIVAIVTMLCVATIGGLAIFNKANRERYYLYKAPTLRRFLHMWLRRKTQVKGKIVESHLEMEWKERE